MTVINNKVISDAVAAAFPNETAILQLGIVDTNRDLSGAGSGDTITLTKFKPISEGLQELVNKGDLIEFEELGQESRDVIVKQYGRGIKIFDKDVQFAVSGGRLEAEAGRQLTSIFARGFDAAAFATLEETAIPAVDATAGLTANLILENILKNFGENALEKTQAIIIPSVVAPQLLLEAGANNLVKASTDGYQATYRFEIGKLFNKIPVIMSDRVRKVTNAEGDIYKSLIVPQGALQYVLGKEVNTESDRNIAEKASYFASDIFYAMASMEDAIVVDTKAL